MTANFWNARAGGGNWTSTVRARAPQVATFFLALAVAAPAGLDVVAMTSRTRKAAAARSPQRPVAPLDIAGLVNAHLFGNASRLSRSGDARMHRPSSMPLVLAGVLATSIPNWAWPSSAESAQAAKVVSRRSTGARRAHS
jgi:hypothetical protein